MLPESKWNAPYIAVEENRKEQHFQKFFRMSELWNAIPSNEIEKSRSWDQLYRFQQESLSAAVKNANSSSYFNQLESNCWQFGKSLSEKDWPISNIKNPHDGFLALKTLRTGSLKNSDPFILERKTDSSCSFYWMSSPSEHHELCMLYHEVFRGYLYHLSRNIRVEITPSILPSSEEKIKSWKISLLWIG
jgi:hypothetical protein